MPSVIRCVHPIVIPFKRAEEQRVLCLTVNRSHDKTIFCSDKSYQAGKSVGVTDAREALHVIGHRGNGVAAGTKRKLAAYIEANNLIGSESYNNTTVYFYAEPFGLPWLDDVKQVTFDEIQAVVVDSPPAEPRSKWRVFGEYHHNFVDTEGLPPADHTVWFCPSDNFSKGDLWNALRSLGLTGLALHNRQVPGFKKNHPEYMHVTEWVNAELSVVGITAADVFHDRRRNSGENIWFDKVPTRPLADPELAELLKTIRRGRATVKYKLDRLVSLALVVGASAERVSTSDFKTALNKMLRRYPVLSTSSNKWNRPFSQGQVIEIINTLHDARKRNPRY